MDKNLDSYIKIYPGLLSKETCAKVVQDLMTVNWQMHSYRDKDGLHTSYDKELDISWDSVSERETVMNTFWQAINKYVNEDLKTPWFQGWSGFTGVRFNKYDKNTQMLEHCDHIHDIFDGELKGIPTLSVLCALNNEYEGGELIFFGDTQYELKAGDIMVFPSLFLYPHKVQEVTSGTRYSCVSWVY